MRTYGRVTDELGNKTWVVVETDAAGFDDNVWITTLCQCIKLAPGEDPFFANYGIPSQASIASQVYPDLYIARLQSQFAQYFAALTIGRTLVQASPKVAPVPTYQINILKNVGTKLLVQVPE